MIRAKTVVVVPLAPKNPISFHFIINTYFSISYIFIVESIKSLFRTLRVFTDMYALRNAMYIRRIIGFCCEDEMDNFMRMERYEFIETYYIILHIH